MKKIITTSDILKLISTTLEVEDGIVNENTTAEDIDSWDSIGQLGILIKLDELFEGKVGIIPEISEATSIAKIFKILKMHSLI
jgi:acyl carrier protein